MVSPSGQLDCDMDVLIHQRLPHSQLVSRHFVCRHAHRLVTHVDCVIQFQHQTQATSNVE